MLLGISQATLKTNNMMVERTKYLNNYFQLKLHATGTLQQISKISSKEA